MTRTQKQGLPLLTFQVRDASNGAIVRTHAGEPLTVSAYTAKSAKHTAKLATWSPVVLEPVRGAKESRA